jgi:ankyrin repeat protein
MNNLGLCMVLLSYLASSAMEKEPIFAKQSPTKRRHTSYERQNTQPNLSPGRTNPPLTSRTKLVDAIEFDNRAKLKRLLNNTPVLATAQFNEEENDTILHVAAQKKCSVETLTYLLNYLEQKKNLTELLRAVNSAGRTPLIEAVQHNNLIAARLLTEHGASYLQADTKDSKTCLHLAILKENELMVTEIINWAGKQNPPVLQELLCSVDYSGRTPCSLAATQDNIDILLKVADENVINLPDNKGCTPLYWSTYRQKPLNVKKIVEAGAKNLSNNEGNYPLHVACMSNTSKSYACLKLLRKFCGTTELRNNERHTALMIAAQRLNKKAFKYLVKKKANLFVQGKHGETIVHLLARTPQAAEFISYYLKNKQVRANDMLETPDYQGRTPLFYALDDSANFTSLVEDHQANITAVDFQLNTVLHAACQKKCPIELISYILDKAHDLIDWTNNDRETALIIATQLGQTVTMELLLAKGASARTTDAIGWSPYQWAATNQGPESLRILNNTNQMSTQEVAQALEVAKKSNNQEAIFYLKSFNTNSSAEEKNLSDTSYSSKT